MKKIFGIFKVIQNAFSRNIGLIAIIVLVISAGVNLYAGLKPSIFRPPVFEWTLLLVGGCSGFLIVTYVIKAHEVNKWQRFRKNMVADFYEQVCDLITLYDTEMKMLMGRARRSRSGYETDYFQVADAPIAVRRFQNKIEQKKTDVFYRLSLSLVGITSEIADDVAEFKSIYFNLYLLTKFIIEVSDITGPQKPTKYEFLKAESAFREIYGEDFSNHGSDERSEQSEMSGLTCRKGSFSLFLKVIESLAIKVKLKTIPVDSLQNGKHVPSAPFIPDAISTSEVSIKEFGQLHSDRIEKSERIDGEIYVLAKRYLKELSGRYRKYEDQTNPNEVIQET